MSNALAHKDDDLQTQIERCFARIEGVQAQIVDFNKELQTEDAELASVADERRRYEALAAVVDNLDKLAAAGGADLFWTGLVAEDQVAATLDRLRDQTGFFERRIKKVTDRRAQVLHKIAESKTAITQIEEEIDYLKDCEERAKNEYVVERELKVLPHRVAIMPWTTQGKDEKKFRRILFLTLLLCSLLAWITTIYTIPIPEHPPVVEIPERLAQLIKKKEKPKPKVEQPKQEEKPAEKKEATKEDRDKAREKVKTKGVLAFKNNFADLLDDASLDKLGANANLSNASSTAKSTQRSLLTSNSGSGGIRSSALSRNVAGTGDQIGAVAFSRVDSAIGTATAEDRALSDGPGASRTDEEIQIVFDKYKAALYRIYNRELRSNPTLQGKIVLRMTIEPDGSVSKCKVESTDMDNKKLLEQIVERVQKFNFGAKEGVPPTTILYPIDFLPAS